MKRLTLLAAAAVLFAAPLCLPSVAQSVGERTGVNSALGVAPSTADFVKEAASSDMFEIQSSQLAQSRTDGTTRTFAAQMIADHQKTTAELTALLPRLGVPAPSGMTPSDARMLENLRTLNGADFTRRYHADQVAAHKNAVSLFERYASSGENAELKAWAARTLPALQRHLQMAQDLDK